MLLRILNIAQPRCSLCRNVRRPGDGLEFLIIRISQDRAERFFEIGLDVFDKVLIAAIK